MPLKITPFTHPEYNGLRQRSEMLAAWWGVAHVFFVLFSIMAAAVPQGINVADNVNEPCPHQQFWFHICTI